MRTQKESLREFPATTWNDVYNRYSTKLRIEEDTVPRSQKEENIRSRRAENEMIRQVLGFLVSNRGIEVNPAQIKAIEEIPDILSNKKKVQRLTWRIAALGRFISKSSEKCFKFFLALKKQDHFEWNEECQQALRNLKTYLSNSPLLAKPKAGEKLLLYLAVSEVAVSAVLVREEQSRLAKWEIELSEYEIAYQPRTAIKSQVLADFSQGIQLEAEKELQVFNGANPGTWTLFIDGSSNVQEKEVRDFIWRNIICRFGVPKEIIYDNGPQFIGVQITKFFHSWQIKRIALTPYHPVGNGQAESTNKVIINNLKKQLEESKGNWPKVLPGVLWAYRTTAKTSIGETPFSLVYGAETLIPVEIGEPSTRFT
ncbi:uncharacterized protein [Nicotiana sylvestris]|uniref:uncharacterized protein n=1 Tax=Nicotiana sylvestris TaxID=4096 RepID=UPI00388CD518